MRRGERQALLYFAEHVRNLRGRYRPRLWWMAVDLLPDPQDWDAPGLFNVARIAESMAYEGRAAK